jgi:hypothetical protein
MIPKPDNFPAFTYEIVCAPIVRFGVDGMPAAIDFNDEFLLCAYKVSNKRPDRLLAAEFVAP